MAKFQCNFISYVLCRTVDVTVVVPSTTIPETMSLPADELTHRPAGKYPVLYLLHGMGNNHAQWTGYTNVEMYAEEHNIAVVMPSGENKFYRDVPGGDAFFRFIADELPEFVKSYFPISDRPEDTYIAGLSMGGYGALMHGLSHPERFGAIGAFSAAIDVDASNVPGAGSGNFPRVTELAKEALADGKKIPPLYLACGEDDDLWEVNSKFKDMMTKSGAEVNWVSLPGYAHEWRFWDLQVEAFIKWLPRTDFYAEAETRKI